MMWLALSTTVALTVFGACGGLEGPQTPASPTRGKSDTGVGSCAEASLVGTACPGGGCTFGDLIEHVGQTICAGSADRIHGGCSVAALDLESGLQASYRGGQPAYAASSIKFVIVAAALHYGVAPWRIAAHARAIFEASSNCAPAAVLDELAATLGAPDDRSAAANAVNSFMHDVVGMSTASSLTRWCPGASCDGYGTAVGCHRATNCGDLLATAADPLEACDRISPLTAGDAITFLRYVVDNLRDSPLWGWSAPRTADQSLGLLGVKSCGLEHLTVHHKVGSLWFGDDIGLVYNDIAIIEVPGRRPLLVALLDSHHASQGQQAHAAYGIYRFVVDRVVDFDGRPSVSGPEGEGTEGDVSPAPADGRCDATSSRIRIVETMNVRSGPGTGYADVGDALPGQSFEVLEHDAGGWVRIGAARWIATYLAARVSCS